MHPWKVIYVSSRAEKKVAERLKEKRIECYVPMKKELKQWSDRKKMVESPLINGYVFVRPDALQRDQVLQQQGVLNYVRYNGGDALVREIEIEALKSIEAKGYFVEGHFGSDLKPGDATIIQAGPFKGLRGQVQTAGDKEIYTIVIDSIDYSLSLQLPREILKKEGKT
ncbi:MAG: UpxY family transcription antiterminator [Bacteroidia bacterium]|nr:UpxY family transcription antiterminator [Bacteroidia bacterium]